MEEYKSLSDLCTNQQAKIEAQRLEIARLKKKLATFEKQDIQSQNQQQDIAILKDSNAAYEQDLEALGKEYRTLSALYERAKNRIDELSKHAAV